MTTNLSEALALAGDEYRAQMYATPRGTRWYLYETPDKASSDALGSNTSVATMEEIASFDTEKALLEALALIVQTYPPRSSVVFLPARRA